MIRFFAPVLILAVLCLGVGVAGVVEGSIAALQLQGRLMRCQKSRQMTER
jgi:hypothetical protein